MSKPRRPETIATHAGRPGHEQAAFVNTPVHRGSTVVFPTLRAQEEANRVRGAYGKFNYGRFGSPSSVSLETAMAELEGGAGAVALPSGVAAIGTTISAFVSAGDHVLMPDSVYGPTRRFCDVVLARFGVETSYYDPLIGGEIEALVRDATRVIYLESPGSLTFEIQDVPAITAVARSRDIVTMIDNTWATPVFLRPFALGVDVSIHAATKYIVGHSDALLGIVVAGTPSAFEAVRGNAIDFGQCCGPDDLYLALRGLRTMPTRLARHEQTGLALAQWLERRPEVVGVIHPGLPSHPGHEVWRRDFLGASGLFAFELPAGPRGPVDALIDGLELFAIGASWGGFESLVLRVYPERYRTVHPWDPGRTLIRLHAGLEAPADLIADLEAGFARYAAAGGAERIG